MCGARQIFEGREILECYLSPQRFERERAIHRAAVEIQVSENLRNALGQAALPRACRSINSDSQFWHFGGTANPGCAHSHERHDKPAPAGLLVALKNP